MKKPEENSDQSDQKTDKDNNKASRRKVIKTALASTAVVGAASQLNQARWSKPLLDSVILPGHAQTTDDTGNLPGDGTTTPNPCPNGPLLCASADLVGDSLSPSTVVATQYNLTATVCPAVAGVEVGLAVTGVNVDNARNVNGYLNGGTPHLTNASGVATFSEVVLSFGAETFGTATARLDLVFTSGGNECTLSLPFSESGLRPPRP